MSHRARELSPGPLSLLEIALLGPLAALVVLWLVPSAVGFEWQCLGTSGVERVPGDTYLAAVVVLGTFGWLLVMVGAIYAQIADSRRVAVLLPLAWFGVFVAGSVIAALSIGAQICPS